MRKLLDLENPNPGKRKGARGQGGEGARGRRVTLKKKPDQAFTMWVTQSQQDSRRNQILGPTTEHKDAANAHREGMLSTQSHKRCIHIIQ